MKLPKKRGQTTVFVIVAIVVVLIVVFLSIRYSDFGNNYDQKTKVFLESFSSCLEGAYGISLTGVAFKGGYFSYPPEDKPYINLSYTIIPYYAYEGENHTPSLDEIKKELIKSAEQNTESFCLSQEYEGIDFSYNDYSVDLEILDNEVKFILDLDMSVVSTANITSLIEFKKKPIVIESRFKDMHYFASEVSKNVISSEGWFDITELSELSRETGLNITVAEEYDDYPAYVYTIYTLDGSHPINYQFANKFVQTNFYFPENLG